MGMAQSVHSNEVSAQGSKLQQMREEGRLVKLLKWSNGPSGIYEEGRSGVRRGVGMN
ncbi:hypothetical protein Peur_011021 [Populus x canadensis]